MKPIDINKLNPEARKAEIEKRMNQVKKMTQEEKQLLLKDLCCRLPYGVKVCARFNTGSRYTTNVTAISADRDYIQLRQNDLHPYTGSSVEDIRPYLRPMSSMTEEEMADYARLIGGVSNSFNTEQITNYKDIDLSNLDYLDKWLNRHHLDYRGLIPKDLAIEVTEKNNPYKEA